MEQRELIIDLIAEDMRIYQLLNGIEQLGFCDDDRYTPNILSIVGRMMGIPEGSISDPWYEAYQSAMSDTPVHLTPEERHSRAVILFEDLSDIR